jgi:hypothetical protein
MRFSFLLLQLPLVIFGYVGYTRLLSVLFGLLGIAAVSVLIGAGVLTYAGRASRTLKTAITRQPNKTESNHITHITKNNQRQ